MNIGVIKEIKKHEYRVGLTPSDVKSYVLAGITYLLKNQQAVMRDLKIAIMRRPEGGY